MAGADSHSTLTTKAARVAMYLVASRYKSVDSVITGYRDDLTRSELEKYLPEAKRLYQRLHGKLTQREKIKLTGLPRPLRDLIAELVKRIGDDFRSLTNGDLSLDKWYALVKKALAEYHIAAWMLGSKSELITSRVWNLLTRQVNAQLVYLREFRFEIQSDAEFQAGWQERAESYANSIKQPYWRGHTKMLPLPAMPAQGTQCLGNCGCLWRVVTIDEKNGDYDAYWERHKDDSCQTCLERAAQWSPVRIREGILL